MNESIGKMVTLLARNILQDLKGVIEPFGITVGEEPYFMVLAHEDGITQEELTNQVGVDKSATARAVKSLMEKEYIRREIDLIDKRNKRLYLTEKAKAKYISLSNALGKYNQELTDEWSQEQYEFVYHSLKTLQEKLEKKKNRVKDVNKSV